MWTFPGRTECILCLSSALSVMALLNHNQMPRLNQTHLTPFHLLIRTVGLRAEGSQFTLEGFPFQIISGTMNYFHLPRQYWRSSLQKMQACGFNTLTTYIPWNLHEPVMNRFYFTENLDFIAFITMTSEVDLWVILCPGPYIGSDLDLGGLPSWLLKDPKMKLRTTYKGFTKAVNWYFDQLIPKIAQFQYKKGGPIIAMQVENEYGSYHMDRKYMSYVKTALVSRGITELLMTADDGLELRRGHLKKVLATVHMKNIQIETYKELSSLRGSSPILMMVYTADSSDTWGTARQSRDPQMLMKDVCEMFKIGFSLNFYMFQGGTNFGFTGGAHSSQGYLPVATTYDYSALLKENGEYTPEYLAFQQFFHSVREVPRYLQPKSTQATAYESLTSLQFMTLWGILPFLDQPIKSVKPLSMEQLPVNQGNGQSYGYTLYETVISTGDLLTSSSHIHDRGQVFLDNKYIGVLDHSKDQLSIVKNQTKKNRILRILVENQGRLSFGPNINKERKGLTGDIYLDNYPTRKFKICSLELKSAFIQRKFPSFWKPVTKKIQGPAFFLSFLRTGDFPQDTFIKVQGWRKGVIFINGQNLGRYWNKGPQETLYIPGPWLHPGINEIMMFEELEGGLKIHFSREAKLGMAC
ncbi:beta-galactosidase-1-like protein 2 [Nannospalax galili]|uniref:Beta-galactosidase n=1 Tax=Nannospalax galili TaxID=1026970 RepID=A0A8C6R5A8_NANGA|nr:beta-galactosidase-1-like protein 2 [Nannospalax galili]